MSKVQGFISQGKLDQAITALSSAIFLAPKEASLYAQRGELYIRMCDFQSALLNYKKVQSLTPSDASVRARIGGLHFVKGNICVEDGEWKQALSSYNEAIRLDSGRVDYRMCRVQVYMHLNHYQSALVDLNRILSTNPHDVSALLRRAKIFVELRELTRGLEDLNTARLLEPNNETVSRVQKSFKEKSKALVIQATAHALQGDHGKALRALADSIRIGATVKAYRLRATVYRQQKQFSPAIEDLKSALALIHQAKAEEKFSTETETELKKQLGVTLNDIGVGLVQLGKLGEAIACIKKAVSLYSNAEFHVNLGKCYKGLDELDNCLAAYEAAVALRKPGKNEHDIDREARMQLGLLRHERGRRIFDATFYKQAIGEFSEAVRLCPKSAGFRLSRGEAYLHKLNFIAAHRDFEKAVELDPSLSLAREKLAWVASKISADKAN